MNVIAEPLPGLEQSITPSEQDALELMARGLSNRGIARRLNISERTAEKRLEKVMWKLGVTADEGVNRRVVTVLRWLGHPTGAPRVWSARKNGPRPPAGAVLVDRKTPFGNPFQIGADAGRADVIARFRVWISLPEQKDLRNRVRSELRGRDLVCWCAPLPCHADVLLAVADTPLEP